MMLKGFQSWFKVVDCSIVLNCLQPNHNKTYSTNSNWLNFVYKLIILTDNFVYKLILGNRKSMNLFGG